MLLQIVPFQVKRSPRPWLTILACLMMLCPLSAAFAAETQEGSEAEDFSFSEEQIEQLVAPIALHPDALLTQILMASTYPLEVVQAARWVEDNPDVTDDALEDAMEAQPWDTSVRSLTAFPQVLEMMNEKLDWTQNLGDAFLAQQEEVLDAVQRLREQAKEAGNLDEMENQTVGTNDVETEDGQTKTVIVIEPADPEVIYLPVYNPTVVYGTWAHPAYPPYFWHPPGYAASRLFWFGTGVIVGRALWGGVNWGRSTVNININRYNQFNRTNINNPRWRHNPSHRRAVPYRDRRVAERYGGPRTRDTRSREQFRGRAETARRDLQRPGAGQRPTDRQARQGAQNQRQRAGQRPADRQVQQPRRDRQAQQPRQTRQTQQRRSATSGAGNGRQVRQDSSRGRSSRSAQRPRPRQSSGGRRRR